MDVPDIGNEGRGLLTEREREILAGEADVSEDYLRSKRSTVKRRLDEHILFDVTLLRDQARDAWDTFAERLPQIYYCPLCGEPYARQHEAMNHLVGLETGHELSTDEIPEVAPDWWEFDDTWE